VSVEHIFPESLGNKEKILPKGVVCDTCNNETLSSLDEELLNFEPILLFRTFHGIESKRGRVPTSNFSDVHLENPTADHVVVRPQSRKNITDQSDTGFKLHFRGNRKMDAKRLKLIARALYKIAFELLYLDHGREFVLSGRFDEVREIILGNRDFSGYLFIGTMEKSSDPGIEYRFFKDNETGREFAFFDFKYFFVQILFDMERRVVQLENGSKHNRHTLLTF
jgi:hypothetical protein